MKHRACFRIFIDDDDERTTPSAVPVLCFGKKLNWQIRVRVKHKVKIRVRDSIML